MTKIQFSYQEYCQLLKKIRTEKGYSIEYVAKKLSWGGQEPHFTEALDRLSKIEANEPKSLTTGWISKLCDIYQLDEISIYNGIIAPIKPTTLPELLEELEPDGLGTPEQRLVRLYVHDQITASLVNQYLDCDCQDDWPKLTSTLCTCPGCRAYCNRE